eukprot:1562657-Alexandrium_andersonii.AAC.1
MSTSRDAESAQPWRVFDACERGCRQPVCFTIPPLCEVSPPKRPPFLGLVQLRPSFSVKPQ